MAQIRTQKRHSVPRKGVKSARIHPEDDTGTAQLSPVEPSHPPPEPPDSPPEPDGSPDSIPEPFEVVQTAGSPGSSPDLFREIEPLTAELEEEPAPRKRVRFPDPPSFKCPGPKFFPYWNKIYEKFGDRVVVYLYRLWPVIDRKRSGFDYSYIDLLVEPLADEDDLQYKYGAGDYHMKLNDALLRKQVCHCNVKGLREMEEHPPVVDPIELVMEDPANAPYIAWARAKGILKDPEGEDMGNEAVKELANITNRLMSQQEKQEAEKSRQQAPSPAPDPSASAMLEGMKIVSQAAGLGTEMIREASKKATDIVQSTQDPTAQAKAFKEMLDTFKAIQTTLSPSPPSAAAPTDTTANIPQFINLLQMFMTKEAELQKQLYQIMADRITRAEQMAQQTANPSQAQREAVSTITPKDPVSEIERLLNLKDKLQDAFGGDEGGRPRDSGPGWLGQIPGILQGLAMVGGVASSIIHNSAVLKTGQGVPVAAPMVPALPGPQPTSQTVIPSAPEGPQPDEPGGGSMQQYHVFLAKIHRPLMIYLSDENRTGADFADWMIDGYGRMAYDQILEPGKDVLVAIIQTYPPIWNDVSKIPDRFDQFLDEFFTRDAIREQEDEEDEREMREPAPRRVKVKPKQQTAAAAPSPGPQPPPAN